MTLTLELMGQQRTNVDRLLTRPAARTRSAAAETPMQQRCRGGVGAELFFSWSPSAPCCRLLLHARARATARGAGLRRPATSPARRHHVRCTDARVSAPRCVLRAAARARFLSRRGHGAPSPRLLGAGDFLLDASSWCAPPPGSKPVLMRDSTRTARRGRLRLYEKIDSDRPKC